MLYQLWQHRIGGEVRAVEVVGGGAKRASRELRWEEYQQIEILTTAEYTDQDAARVREQGRDWVPVYPMAAVNAQGALPEDAKVERDSDGGVVTITAGDAHLERPLGGYNQNKAYLYRQANNSLRETNLCIHLGTGLVVWHDERAERELLERNGLTVEAILATMRPVAFLRAAEGWPGKIDEHLRPIGP